MTRPKVAVIVDGPDPDNYIAVLAALSPMTCFDLVAVIMTGRPVSVAQKVPPFWLNPHASRAVRRDNALHAKGVLMRHGGERIPVFEGGRAPYSTVPHHMHIHERVTDVFDDAHAGHVLAGDIDDAVVYLASLPGMTHIICGGPMTDLEYLMRQPMLAGKLGIVTAQLGMFGFGRVRTLAGGRKQFNALADAGALFNVLMHYPEAFYMIPTDVTKDPDHGFASADEFAMLAVSGAFQEAVAMYRRAWPEMWGKLGISAHVHDFHPVELMDLLLRQTSPHHTTFSVDGRDTIGRYTVSPVGIEHVPHLMTEMERWGEIDLGPYDPNQPLRFLIDGCDTGQHRAILAATLNSLSSASSLTPVPVY